MARRARLCFLCLAMVLCLLLGSTLLPPFTASVLSDSDNPHVTRAEAFHTALSLRDTRPDPHLQSYYAPVNRELLAEEAPLPDADGTASVTALDANVYPAAMPTPVNAFSGMALPEGAVVSPPDMSGEMGRDYFVQAVNARVQVFGRDGVSVFGPVNLGTLWAELGQPCAQSHGDPNVLYDQFAGRWLIAQPVFSADGTLGICAALSDTEDPTATYTLYYFPLEENYIYDFPMFAVWHDAYYMTASRFTRNWAPAGVAFVAFERDAMLARTSAQALVFNVSNATSAVVADADGPTLPDTAPVFFALRSTSTLRVWRAFPNWQDPEHSNLNQIGDITVAEHDSVCSGCVAQPDTMRLLASHTNRLSHEASYRNFGSYDAVILTHATSVGGASNQDHAGVRWYEIRGIRDGVYQVYQESTFAPEDGVSRWMPAAMQDTFGNLLLHYTASSASVYPEVRYAGRQANDPVNTLPRGEVVLQAGSGSQTGNARWGDYASIALDPLDDCTFWFTNEYIAETNTFTWATAIGAVRFPECVPSVTPTPAPSLTPTPEGPTVTPSATATHTPLPTATATHTPLPTATATHTPLPTATEAPVLTPEVPEAPTYTPTLVATFTVMSTPTLPPTLTATASASPTILASPSPTVTGVPPTITPSAGHALYLPLIRR